MPNETTYDIVPMSSSSDKVVLSPSSSLASRSTLNRSYRSSFTSAVLRSTIISSKYNYPNTQPKTTDTNGVSCLTLSSSKHSRRWSRVFEKRKAHSGAKSLRKIWSETVCNASLNEIRWPAGMPLSSPHGMCRPKPTWIESPMTTRRPDLLTSHTNNENG